MITAASLKSYTVKELGEMAKKKGLAGWSSMRKEQLVRALLKHVKARAAKRTSKSRSSAPARKSRTLRSAAAPSKNGHSKSAKTTAAKSAPTKKQPAPQRPKNSRVAKKIQEVQNRREQQKDLANGRKSTVKRTARPNPRTAGPASAVKNGRLISKNGARQKDRIVLLVRDSYWLQACWEITRHSVQRAKAAMAEHWHTAKPVLRLLEVESGATTSTAERVSRDIEIHGGVTNWYIDVYDPPQSYRVDIGYLAENGKFFALARSNTVSTPRPGSSDAIDENWTDIADNYEKIYAQSGGYEEENGNGELQSLFEERLRRPMGSPVVTKFGVGAESMLNRDRNFEFELDAEMIIYGSTKPTAHVTLAGEPVKLRPDGTFTVRLSMPDKRQVLPAVASSADGVEQRTIVLAVERNTKVMEPVVRDSND